MPDTASESAKFDLFGSYAVTFDGTGGPVTVNDLTVVRGGVTLRANGVADAQLVVTGDASLAGQITLAEIVGTYLDLDVQGALSVAAGTQFEIEGGPLAAGSMTVAGGTSTAVTSVKLLDGATADLGDLTVAASGNLASRGEFNLYDGASASVLAMRIAADAAAGRGEVNISGSTLTQPATSQTQVGFGSLATGAGVLAIASGGTAELGSTFVNSTGKIANAGGTLRVVGTSFGIDGGKYTESGSASRDFSAASSIRVGMGGAMTLVGAPLVVASTQSLTVADGVISSTGGIVIDGGRLSVGGPTSTINSSVTLEAGAQLMVGDIGTTTVNEPFVDNGAEVRFLNGATLAFASDYTGYGAVGNGLLRFEADSNAGSGVATATIAANVEWTDGARLVIDMTDAETCDKFLVGGTATLDGELVLSPVGGSPFTPAEGATYPILTAGTLAGAFATLDAPTLGGGLEWRLLQTPTSLRAIVVAPSVAGDFNYDGVVNAADYTVWRDTEGSAGPQLAADANGDDRVDQTDYLAWRAAYGGPGVTAIPEPGSGLLAAILTAAGAYRRRE